MEIINKIFVENPEWVAIVLSMLIGIYVSYITYKKNQTPSEYFKARGFLTKSLIFFSVFSTAFSAFTVIGLPAMFFKFGIGTFLFMYFGILLTPVVLYYIGMKIIRSSNDTEENLYMTPVSLLTSSYKSKAITIILSVITIVVLFPYFVLQIAGVGKYLISFSNGNTEYIIWIFICCVIAGSYTIFGGAKADAKTDQIQGIILIIATILVGIVLLISLNNSVGFAQPLSILKEKGLLSIPGPDKSPFSWPYLISYFVIFSFISVSTPQVSQKLMGIKDEKDLNPILIFYPIAGFLIVAFAGLIGFYAVATNLSVSSPDFVIGDVLKSLKPENNSGLLYLFTFLSILFTIGVISAAVSTIDSLILAITGIIRDTSFSQDKPKISLKIFSLIILVFGFVIATKPPEFIVSLAQIQLGGLTALLPCLLAPLFGVRNKFSGWLSLIFGLTPLILTQIKALNIKSYWGFEAGLFCLLTGILGVLIGLWINKRTKNTATNTRS
jgi:Na+/proline symporter